MRNQKPAGRPSTFNPVSYARRHGRMSAGSSRSPPHHPKPAPRDAAPSIPARRGGRPATSSRARRDMAAGARSALRAAANRDTFFEPCSAYVLRPASSQAAQKRERPAGLKPSGPRHALLAGWVGDARRGKTPLQSFGPTATSMRRRVRTRSRDRRRYPHHPQHIIRRRLRFRGCCQERRRIGFEHLQPA